ncbi:MAG: hypothetical protein ACLGIK_16905, partial [Gemmatimonadota bacterium]
RAALLRAAATATNEPADLLRAALADAGIPCRAADWADPAVDWAAADAVVVRSTWNYAPRRDEFLAWARRVEAATRLVFRRIGAGSLVAELELPELDADALVLEDYNKGVLVPVVIERAIGLARARGIPIVDGSSSLFDLLRDDPDAPGAIPIADAPELLRRDFVFNANDSYGFANPAAPLAGDSPFYGAADQAPSARGLMNLRLLREKGVAAASGPDFRFSRDEAVR